MAVWLLHWDVSIERLRAVVDERGGRVLGRRKRGVWRVGLPAGRYRPDDFGPGARIEPELRVDRVRRPLRAHHFRAPAGIDLPRFSIRVVDGELGVPLARVTVIAHGPSGRSYRGRTDEDGRASIPICEDRLSCVEVLPPDAHWPHLVETGLDAGLSEAGGQALNLGLDPLPPSIERYGWGKAKAMKIDRVHRQGIRGAGIRCAVLDTGVSPHPDLRIAGGTNTADEEDPSLWRDTHWHGTHVAGILAAIGRRRSLVGVAPKADLYAVRVGRVVGTDAYGFSNEMFETDLLEGIQWCIDQQIDVINMSLFSQQTLALDRVLEDAYRRGIVIVAPAGNHRRGDLSLGLDYPARSPWVISVGALGRLGTYPPEGYFRRAEQGARFSPAFPDYYVPGFSKTGEGLDFVAPGVAILSTVPPTLKGWDVDNRRLTGYTSWMGTSQAAPFIAGLVALILESDPELRGRRDAERVERVRDVLVSGSVSLGMDPYTQGYGMPLAPACIRRRFVPE